MRHMNSDEMKLNPAKTIAQFFFSPLSRHFFAEIFESSKFVSLSSCLRFLKKSKKDKCENKNLKNTIGSLLYGRASFNDDKSSSSDVNRREFLFEIFFFSLLIFFCSFVSFPYEIVNFSNKPREHTHTQNVHR